MIARFTTLLPFVISIPEGEDLPPFECERDGYRVRVYPPYQAGVTAAEVGLYSTMSYGNAIKRLQRREPQQVTSIVRINDKPTVLANLMQVDFLKEEFDRRRTSPGEADPPGDSLKAGDPPPSLAFAIVNDVIARFRTLCRGGHVQTVDPRAAFWRLDYLNDAEEIMPPGPMLLRRRGNRNFRGSISALTGETWQAVQQLGPDFAPHVWDTLVLDAEKNLPDTDSAVALANAALEVFSKWLLDQFASTASLPDGLWHWINKRGFHLKEPSVEDRFDHLLKCFTGRSLKEEGTLWKAFKELREARNSLSHVGSAKVGTLVVTPEHATNLVMQAHQIMDWCEGLLPEACRRPRPAGPFKFQFTLSTEGFPTLPAEESTGDGK